MTISTAIPPEIAKLSELEGLSMAGNAIKGSIPSELGSLSKLVTLRLGNNQLSGSIPSSLSRLSALQTLSLEANQLTGSVPQELGQLNNLGSIRLDGNAITGELPQQWSQLQLTSCNLGTGICFRDSLAPRNCGTVPVCVVTSSNVSSGLGVGGIVGITLGAVMLVVLVVVLGLFIRQRQKMKQYSEKKPVIVEYHDLSADILETPEESSEHVTLDRDGRTALSRAISNSKLSRSSSTRLVDKAAMHDKVMKGMMDSTRTLTIAGQENDLQRSYSMRVPMVRPSEDLARRTYSMRAPSDMVKNPGTLMRSHSTVSWNRGKEELEVLDPKAQEVVQQLSSEHSYVEMRPASVVESRAGSNNSQTDLRPRLSNPYPTMRSHAYLQFVDELIEGVAELENK
ncbi:hypothetical protein EDD86DRAFT_215073 [Gorgonomyces haynaldii]|nr:hypothetical protein EDD86DRAFT_215073 [Gorgonomyces haynaldii]